MEDHFVSSADGPLRNTGITGKKKKREIWGDGKARYHLKKN